MVLFGADRVEEYAHLFIGRTALLTGPSGRTSGNEPTFEALKRCWQILPLTPPFRIPICLKSLPVWKKRSANGGTG